MQTFKFYNVQSVIIKCGWLRDCLSHNGLTPLTIWFSNGRIAISAPIAILCGHNAVHSVTDQFSGTKG